MHLKSLAQANEPVQRYITALFAVPSTNVWYPLTDPIQHCANYRTGFDAVRAWATEAVPALSNNIAAEVVGVTAVQQALSLHQVVTPVQRNAVQTALAGLITTLAQQTQQLRSGAVTLGLFLTQLSADSTSLAPVLAHIEDDIAEMSARWSKF